MAEIMQINDNSWRIEDNGVRFFYWPDQKSMLMIAVWIHQCQAIAESITKLPIILLNTHADPDHISGNGSFNDFYMHPDEEDNYRAHGGVGSILPVKENDIIDIGNRPLKIIFIPGHTPGSIAVLDINNRVLISGDSIQDGNIFMFKNTEIYLCMLRAWRSCHLYWRVWYDISVTWFVPGLPGVNCEPYGRCRTDHQWDGKR